MSQKKQNQGAEGVVSASILKRTVLSGLSHHSYSLVAQEIQPGVIMSLERDLANRFDSDAIKIMHESLFLGKVQVGWVPKGQNDVLAKLLDAGCQLIGGVISHDFKNPRLDERLYIAIYLHKSN